MIQNLTKTLKGLCLRLLQEGRSCKTIARYLQLLACFTPHITAPTRCRFSSADWNIPLRRLRRPTIQKRVPPSIFSINRKMPHQNRTLASARFSCFLFHVFFWPPNKQSDADCFCRRKVLADSIPQPNQKRAGATTRFVESAAISPPATRSRTH